MNIKALVIIAFAVTLIVVGTYLFSSLAPHLEAIQNGELTPFNVDEQKPFDAQIGGVHIILSVNDLEGYDFRKAFNLGGVEYPFELKYVDGKLVVSAEIKNTNGDVVAKIVDNQWSVNFNPIVTYDRNYNSYAFEVIDSDRVPILQVVLKPENNIFIGGVFHGENGTIVAQLNGTTLYNYEDYKYAQTIFRYPSESNLGKLVPNSLYAFGGQVILAPNEISAIGYVLFGIGTFVTLVIGLESFKRKNQKRKRRSKKVVEKH
jgi:hypothetical protein